MPEGISRTGGSVIIWAQDLTVCPKRVDNLAIMASSSSWGQMAKNWWSGWKQEQGCGFMSKFKRQDSDAAEEEAPLTFPKEYVKLAEGVSAGRVFKLSAEAAGGG